MALVYCAPRASDPRRSRASSRHAERADWIRYVASGSRAMRNVLRKMIVTMLALLCASAAGFVALILWSLPSPRLLSKARRGTLDGVTTIDDAIAACQQSGLRGWALVASAQQ